MVWFTDTFVDRNSAFNYWVADTDYTPVASALIINGGYLLRSAKVDGSCLHLVGDLNATTTFEVVGGAPESLSKLTFNGESVEFTQAESGIVTAEVEYTKPSFAIPDLSSIGWKYLDSLPEVQADYDDSAWPHADLTYSNNTARNLTTPTSLYGGDYGFNAGSLVFRGHFTGTGTESTLFLATQGGSAFGYSVWLGCDFVGSFAGADVYDNWNATYDLPSTSAGDKYVLTVLIDHMGLNENGRAGSSEMKKPRGILDYSLAGHAKEDVKWKVTGNLGGEDYKDRARGPLNEGGLYAERQGYHLPGAPASDWEDSAGPSEGISAPGVAFYSTTFDLDMPAGYDIPLSFSFTNSTSDTAAPAYYTSSSALSTAYRIQIFVNGYQFGEYVHNIGPQDVFPVPEGIWNYHGSNYVAMSLWALEEGGAKVEGLELVAGPVIQSGYGEIELSPMDGWVEREGSY